MKEVPGTTSGGQFNYSVLLERPFKITFECPFASIGGLEVPFDFDFAEASF